ncbi:MAG: ATP-dependent DNA helicase [Oscillospiraceae bacterium]|nr:ATP-dependent DNA helicase [Oscillospiraceae bacterium]
MNHGESIIDRIFRVILPKHGYAVREDQIRLSMAVYHGFCNKQVSLLESEVGTGKTLAYLVAGVAALKENGADTAPITITTSSIELQTALVEREIPQLSRILLNARVICQPLTTVLRKGKEHYFCLRRFQDYLGSIHPAAASQLADRVTGAFDLDELDLPGHIKDAISVQGGCRYCPLRANCKYVHFLRYAQDVNRPLSFQVTNHNLYLMSRTHPKLLRPSSLVVVDEAHKLKEAAQSAFGASISEKDIPNYLNWSKTLCRDRTKQTFYKMEQSEAVELNDMLFSWLRTRYHEEEETSDGHSIVDLNAGCLDVIHTLIDTLERLERMRSGFGGYSTDIGRITTSLEVLRQKSFITTWVEMDENGSLTLCGCPKNLNAEFETCVWTYRKHHVLLSGTLSDGRDFRFYKQEHGLDRLHPDRIEEHMFPSPFDYQHQTRLYLAKGLPWPDNSDSYFREISKCIVRLIQATCGHTAILFTSYRALQRVHELTAERLRDYEVICMTRSNRTAIDTFRRSRNGVLFASGSMWEGVDCVGDCLSSLIIVRLPFPQRSAVMELKRSRYDSVRDFVNEYAVPEMLIKLRQGAGRLIRSETDTGVIVILDARATRSRHEKRVKQALTQYPQVYSIKELRTFMRSVKPDSYFHDRRE